MLSLFEDLFVLISPEGSRLDTNWCHVILTACIKALERPKHCVLGLFTNFLKTICRVGQVRPWTPFPTDRVPNPESGVPWRRSFVSGWGLNLGSRYRWRNYFFYKEIEQFLCKLAVPRLWSGLHGVLVKFILLGEGNRLLPPSSLLVDVSSDSSHFQKLVCLNLTPWIK